MNRTARSVAALAAGITLALAVPLTASAHVTIDPGQAAAGSFTVITLTVPNESDTASTDRVELTLPSDTPFTSVRYVPVAGWSTELMMTTLPSPVKVGENSITEAVTSVVWTASPGAEIRDGALQLFPLSVGPVPDTGSIALPAEQSYTDGTTVSWSDVGEGAQHPAPVLYVNDPPVAAHDDDGDGDGDHVEASAPAESVSSPDVLARVLGIGGLVVGVVGLVLAITVRRAATPKGLATTTGGPAGTGTDADPAAK